MQRILVIDDDATVTRGTVATIRLPIAQSEHRVRDHAATDKE